MTKMKMKTKTLFYMALMAVMTTLAACSQDDDMQQDAAPVATPIEFEITDGGYGGNEATRAVEEGYYTRFTAGDECGLYIVNGSTLKAKNVKLTASEENGKLTWKAADGAISDVTENSKYFLYYPYPDDNEKIEEINNTEMNSAADKDTDFFENLISGWEVQSNQRNHDNYTASDLMTAKGTATYDGTTLKLSFKLDHRMALAEIVAPVEASFSLGTYCYTPYQAEEWKYRFIVNPKTVDDSKSIKGSIASKTFTINSAKLKALTPGQYKTFKVGSSYYMENVPGGTPIYHVYDYNGLMAWAAVGGNYSCKLEADITMPELKDGETYNWTPVDIDNRATFDGNGHTITGLKVNSTGSSAGFIANNHGTVKNLTLKGATITCSDIHVGGVVGYNNGTISGCHVAEDCSVKGNIGVGGIAGGNNGGTVTGCYALCSLEGNVRVGGLIGVFSGSGSLTACYSKCSYSNDSDIGGIVGNASGNPTFTACYWQGCTKGVGSAASPPEGITQATDWSAAAEAMNNALGADFGYQYEVNGDSQTEPLILVKEQ